MTLLLDKSPVGKRLLAELSPQETFARVALLQTQAEAAGAQEISRILGKGLTQRGHDVHHVYLFRRTAVFDEQPNTFFCAGERPANPVAVLRTLHALVQHLRTLRPDVVLCFQHYGNIIGAVAARLAGIPLVVANRNSAKALEPLWTRCVDLAFGSTGTFSRVVVNCATIAEEYGGHPKAYRKRLRRINHGFAPKRSTLSKSDARRRLGLPNDLPLLGSVGRLHAGKNLSAAVDLLSEQDWHLALVGQGPEREQLLDLAHKCGVAHRLHLLGETDADGVAAFLRALDVFVFPSSMETFGLAAVEAAAAGIPVVANDLDVLREVLAGDGKPAAMFVNAGDTAAFAGAVQTVLENGELRETLARRGSALAERYSLNTMVDRYAALIDELMIDDEERIPNVSCV